MGSMRQGLGRCRAGIGDKGGRIEAGVSLMQELAEGGMGQIQGQTGWVRARWVH